MRNTRIIGVALIGISLVLVACSPARQPATAQINIEATHDPMESWRPSVAPLAAGGVVTWKNTGEMQHAVISGEGLFNQSLSPGQSFNFIFTHSGNFTYHDDPNVETETIVVK